MLRRFTKKHLALLLVPAAALALAGGAYAYFTGTGSGTGSGSVGGATNDITVAGTETAALYPGGAGGAVSLKASNPANYNQKLSKVHLVSITPDAGHSTCSVTIADGTGSNDTHKDFYMPDVLVGSDGDLAPKASGTSLSESGTLYMNDTTVDQSACEGATLTLTLSTS